MMSYPTDPPATAGNNVFFEGNIHATQAMYHANEIANQPAGMAQGAREINGIFTYANPDSNPSFEVQQYIADAACLAADLRIPPPVYCTDWDKMNELLEFPQASFDFLAIASALRQATSNDASNITAQGHSAPARAIPLGSFAKGYKPNGETMPENPGLRKLIPCELLVLRLFHGVVLPIASPLGTDYAIQEWYWSWVEHKFDGGRYTKWVNFWKLSASAQEKAEKLQDEADFEVRKINYNKGYKVYKNLIMKNKIKYARVEHNEAL